MRIKYFTKGLIVASLFLASCSTPKNVTYFQDVTQGDVIETIKKIDIRVRPDDKMLIMVTTQDPSLTELFNLMDGSTGSGSRKSYYTVDAFGDINFPVIGKLHIEGMNRADIAGFIEKKLKERNLVKDPVVTVDFANTGISVLGEVKSPGRYEFNKDRITIVEGLALAGDLTTDGQRENIIVMRELEDGKQQTYRINLTDLASLSNSPAYYLQQNDVIYVEPNDKKKRDTTPTGNSPFTPSFWISAGSLAITVATFIVTLTRL